MITIMIIMVIPTNNNDSNHNSNNDSDDNNNNTNNNDNNDNNANNDNHRPYDVGHGPAHWEPAEARASFGRPSFMLNKMSGIVFVLGFSMHYNMMCCCTDRIRSRTGPRGTR